MRRSFGGSARVTGHVVAALALFLVYPRYDLVAREDWLRVLLWGLPAALVVAGMTVGPSVLVVRWNPLPLLGAASYAIYLTHWIVAAVMGGPWNGYPISTLVGSVSPVSFSTNVLNSHCSNSCGAASGAGEYLLLSRELFFWTSRWSAAGTLDGAFSNAGRAGSGMVRYQW